MNETSAGVDYEHKKKDVSFLIACLIEQYQELYQVVLSEYETSSNPRPFSHLVRDFESTCAELKRELMIEEK